jgi:beta-phosphoglucomutase-like phosphatase (HAD superfamily)
MFDAVIFDCDGVLVDSETLALEMELEELAALGLVYERDTYCARFMGMNNQDFYAELDADRRALTGEPLPDAFRHSQRERMIKACEGRLAEVPGAGRAVAAWRGPKAVASSSGSRMLKLKLQTTGLWDLFHPYVYGGDMVERGKPAPDLFLMAAAGLGLDPARCLVIEDTSNGVRGARAAGASVWGFLGGGHMGPGDAARLLEAGAERVLPDWAEVEGLFQGWNKAA